ncbi:uncharacterized protein LOC110026973 [Phalaenopsis equestris]|uniref:uncharacterized protein LOC110026973 n=1 Tax=Phalaenopsis equestris TaxID=78828 RepID=UPI0009E57F81|nr:uncharacterized protein LOC110026973 [Phalaenopsis equestris]
MHQAPQPTPMLPRAPPQRDRKSSLRIARLADEAERYDHAALFIKEIIATTYAHTELTPKEGCLLAAAFKNLIIYARTALRSAISASSSWHHDPSKQDLAVDYFHRCKEEIVCTCMEFLQIIEQRLLPTSKSRESMIYYLTLKGEFTWYLAENKENRSPGMPEELVAKAAYYNAWDFAKDLDAMNPYVLALAFSYAEFHSEFLNNPIEALQIIQRTVDVIGTLQEDGKPAHTLLSFEGGLQLYVNLLNLQGKINYLLKGNAAGASNIPAAQVAGPPNIPAGVFNIPAGDVAGPSNIPAGNVAGHSYIPPSNDAAETPVLPPKYLAAVCFMLGTDATKHSSFLASYILGASNTPAGLLDDSVNLPVGGVAGPSNFPMNYEAGPSNVPMNYAAGPSNVPMNYAAVPSNVPMNYAAGPSNVPMHYAAGFSSVPADYAAGPSNIPIINVAGASNIPAGYAAGPSNIPILDVAGASNIPAGYAAGPSNIPIIDITEDSNIPEDYAAGPSNIPVINIPTDYAAEPSNIPIVNFAGTSNIPGGYAAGASNIPASNVAGVPYIPAYGEEEEYDFAGEFEKNPNAFDSFLEEQPTDIPPSAALEPSDFPGSNSGGNL